MKMWTTWPMVLLWWNLELSKNSILVKPKLTSFLRPELAERGLLQPPWRVRKNAFVEACLCTLVRKIDFATNVWPWQKTTRECVVVPWTPAWTPCRKDPLPATGSFVWNTTLLSRKTLTSLHSRSRVPLWFEIGVFSVFSQKEWHYFLKTLGSDTLTGNVNDYSSHDVSCVILLLRTVFPSAATLRKKSSSIPFGLRFSTKQFKSASLPHSIMEFIFSRSFLKQKRIWF